VLVDWATEALSKAVVTADELPTLPLPLPPELGTKATGTSVPVGSGAKEVTIRGLLCLCLVPRIRPEVLGVALTEELVAVLLEDSTSDVAVELVDVPVEDSVSVDDVALPGLVEGVVVPPIIGLLVLSAIVGLLAVEPSA